MQIQPTNNRPLALPRPDDLVMDLPAEPFRKRHVRLLSDRSWYDTEVQMISKFLRPRRSRWAADADTSARARDRRSTAILNNTGTIAGRTLASGMHTGASSPARPWFRLTTPGDPDLAENGEVKEYLTSVARRMQTVFSRSNIYTSLHQGYGDLGDFGTSVMMIDENYDNVIRTHVFSPGEYCLAVDADGIVNTLYREFQISVIGMMRKWGSRCSERVIRLYNSQNYDQLVTIVDAVEPNMQQVRGEIGPRGAPFLRVYFEKNEDGRKMLEVKGLSEFPACTPRWDIRDGDVYGFGCGLEALDDVMGLQMLEQRKQMIADKLATPPTQGGPATKKINHRAGEHTAVPGNDVSGAQGGIRVLYDMNPSAITALAKEIARAEDRIRSTYYSDLFLMFAQSDRREITAREVDERHEEKLLALGPVIERLHNENLDPAITRTYNIMQRAGLFPDPPQALQSMDLKVQFISTLAQAQRAVSIGGIERLAGFVGNLVAVYPSVKDKFDADQAVDEYADATGVPPSVVLTDDRVAKIREDAAQAAQGQAMAAAAAGAADTAKVLSETDVTDENLLGQIAGGVGAY